MGVSWCFRLFDLENYAQVAPVIHSLVNGISDQRQITYIIEKSLEVLNGVEFRRYNDEFEIDVWNDTLNDAKILIEKNRCSEFACDEKALYAAHRSNFYPQNESQRIGRIWELIDAIVYLLCYPKFQFRGFNSDEVISETLVDIDNEYRHMSWVQEDFNELILGVLIPNRGKPHPKYRYTGESHIFDERELKELHRIFAEADTIINAVGIQVYKVHLLSGNIHLEFLSKPPENIQGEYELRQDIHQELKVFCRRMLHLLQYPANSPKYSISQEMSA
jgi:hypothetical protein